MTDNADRLQLMADGLVSVREAARFLDISKSKLYALMESGALRYVKFGKCRRIPRAALLNLAAANLVS